MKSKLSTKQIELLDKAFQECRYKTVQDIAPYLIKLMEMIRKGGHNENPQLRLYRAMTPQAINEILCLGIYNSISSGDFMNLLNSLYTYNHMLLLQNQQLDLIQHSGGYDCTHVFPIISAYAGNNLNIAKRYTEQYPNYSSKGHRYTKVLCNLVMSVITDNEQWRSKALNEAYRFITLKNTKYDNASVEFMIGLLSRNANEMSTNLAEAVKLYSSNKSLHDFFNDINKFAAIQPYGLFSIAYHHLPSSLFRQIDTPTHFSWWEEYVHLNLEGNFQPGGDFVTFDGELSFIHHAINSNR